MKSIHRSFDPDSGRTEKDRRAREKQRKRLEEIVIPLSLVKRENVLPKGAPVSGTPVEDMIPIGIPADGLTAFGQKLTRGTRYALKGEYVEPDRNVVVLPPMYEQEEPAQTIKRAIREYGTFHSLSPGFGAGIGLTWSQQNASGICEPVPVFRFEIWNKLTIYARIQRAEIM